MKPVSDLYGKHAGSDIYVIGTGTSLRVFPVEFFQGKITVGLNSAWKHVPVTYGLTIHPDHAVPEFQDPPVSRPEITWVTKYNKTKRLCTAEQFDYADERFYFFENEGKPNTMPPGDISDAGRVVDWLLKPTDNFLYIWTTISQAGANLAANLGARNVIMVGCDNCALLDNHHAHQQHTRWLGAQPDDRYRQYYDGLAEARYYLRQRGVNLVSMTPFLGLQSPDQDFLRLCEEMERETLILPGPDISPAPPAPAPASTASPEPLLGKLRSAAGGVKRRVKSILPGS